VVPGRVEDAHADRGQPVGRDDGADIVQAEAEPRGDRPDIAPLRALDRLATGDEILEGAERDHILGEQRMRTGEIDRADLLGQPLEPLFDAGEIVGIGRGGQGNHSRFAG